MPHAYSGMRHWKPGMYSGTRRRLCWTELCDLVEIWLFTVKCFVFKWPWPWWELLEVVWMCTVAGGVTESVQRGGKFPVPLHFCIFFSKIWKVPDLKSQEKKEIAHIYVAFVCSLLTYHLLLVSKSAFTDVYVAACGLLLCSHCLPVLLNADTILHWLV